MNRYGTPKEDVAHQTLYILHHPHTVHISWVQGLGTMHCPGCQLALLDLGKTVSGTLRGII